MVFRVYLMLFTIYLIFFEQSVARNYYTAFGHAAPLSNRKLAVTPLMTIPRCSLLLCMRKCLLFDWCNSFNYNHNDACELLDTYLCETTMTLTEAQGYRYYDVDLDETSENIENYRNRERCQHNGKCSPKCGCEWTDEFVVYSGMYIAGYTETTLSSVSMEQCQRACASEVNFLCKSIDYNNATSMCYLSTVNRQDEPQAYQFSATYTYNERICQ